MLQPLKRRLTAWYLLTLALVLCLYGLGTYGVVREALYGGIDEANRHLVAPALSSFLRGESDLSEVSHEVGELILSAGEHLEILDLHGRVLFDKGGALPATPVTLGIGRRSAPEAMRTFTVPLERAGRRLGYVRASHQLLATDQALQMLGLSLALLVPVALMLAWATGNWLAQKASRPIEAAMERERQFTRDASHELRTPLAVLQAQSELALRLPGLSEEGRRKLELFARTTRRMAGLVGDLLTLSREDAGFQDNRLPFDLDELLDEELTALRPLAQSRHVSLVLEHCEALSVVGEPVRVAQAVRNLLDNAIRYTPPSGVVTVRLSREGAMAQLVVSNTGPDIARDERERLFERFHRAPSAREANPEGSGLGLAISRSIVRRHGGEISVASEGGLTAFTLRLPAAGRA